MPFIAWIYKMTDNAIPTTIMQSAMRNGKRERKHTAQTLPPGITHNMMKKFVVYYREVVYLKNGKQQPREYFKVESHPKLSKPWVSSKSIKIPLIEKLNEANNIVDELELAEAPPTENTEDTLQMKCIKQLPKYTTVRIMNNVPSSGTRVSIIYDKKDTTNGFRWTSSHTFILPNDDPEPSKVDATLSLEIHKLKEKLRHKYDVDLWNV